MWEGYAVGVKNFSWEGINAVGVMNLVWGEEFCGGDVFGGG